MEKKDVITLLFEEFPIENAWDELFSSSDRNYLPVDFWPNPLISSKRAYEIREIAKMLENGTITVKEI